MIVATSQVSSCRIANGVLGRVLDDARRSCRGRLSVEDYVAETRTPLSMFQAAWTRRCCSATGAMFHWPTRPPPSCSSRLVEFSGWRLQATVS